MGATRPHNPAARGELLGATAPRRNRSQTKNNKPAQNTKFRILPASTLTTFADGLLALMRAAASRNMPVLASIAFQ